MSKGLVVVTGANGYIAARTVEALLEAGFSVRGTVRSIKSAAPVKEALARFGDKLSFVQVPDITAPGAFDEAFKGAFAVAHTASPVAFSFPDPDPVIHTAKRSVLEALQSAAKEPSVKHFVFMSSASAIRGPRQGDYTYTEKDWNEYAPAELARLGKQTPGPLIYGASKVAGERELWRFRDEEKPSFTVVSVNPV